MHGAKCAWGLLGAMLLAGAAGCTDNTLPLEVTYPVQRSVLVVNATCASGPCQPVHVLGFPQSRFMSPAGPWTLDLGIVSGASACLVIPAVAEAHITDTGTGVTTTFTWTTADSISLGVLSGSTTRFEASPSTPDFVPASEAGWQVALPGTATAIATSAACAP